MNEPATPPAAAILAAGLICAAGKNFAQAVQHYATRGITCAAELSAIGPDGKPPILALAMPFDQPRDAAKRLVTLALIALTDADANRSIAAQAATPVVVLLPHWAPAKVRDAIQTRCPPAWGAIRFVQSQTASSLAQVAYAAQAIAEQKIGGAVICAVDSLANAERMDALMLNDLMFANKTNPYGIIPGEAAAVLHLGPDGARGAIGRARAVRAEPEAPSALGALRGHALGTCLRTLAPFMTDAPPNRLLTDLSGPRTRAEAFGVAITAGGPAVTRVAQFPEAPALALGDTGAAFGLVLACLALAHAPATYPDGAIALVTAAEAGSAALIQRYETDVTI